MVSASSGVGLSHILKELITETSGEGLVIENIPEECIGKHTENTEKVSQ